MVSKGRVLVTGHLGYIGSQVTDVAARESWAVKGLDVGLYAPGPVGAVPGIESVEKDVRDVEREDLRGVTAIVHLAGLSSDPLSALVPDACRSVNQEAAVRLAELARDAGVSRFVFASTVGVYGNTGETWCDEDTPLRPVTVYRETKVYAERDIRAMAGSGFSPVMVRMPTLYGDSPVLRRDLVVNLFVYRAVEGLPLRVDGGGEQWRPLLHVRDAARGLVALCSAPAEKVTAGVVNLCQEPQNLRVGDVARQVAAAFPELDLEWPPVPAAAPGSYRVRSNVLADWLPDYTPAYDTEKGIRELRERLERRPLSPKEVEVGVRVAYVRQILESGRIGTDLRKS